MATQKNILRKGAKARGNTVVNGNRILSPCRVVNIRISFVAFAFFVVQYYAFVFQAILCALATLREANLRRN
jgi:hypothetical protein